MWKWYDSLPARPSRPFPAPIDVIAGRATRRQSATRPWAASSRPACAAALHGRPEAPARCWPVDGLG
eukprot:13059701-Alexandrium_andersonii.AAC.1